jgi:regulator of protease activity HflC (stomatin/prohibitin superfamily)
MLMNLRGVPDDEADEVRELLESHHVDYYETPPHRWGISMGAIWLRDDTRLAEVQSLLAAYQRDRQQRARQALAEARAEGNAETFLGRIRREPVSAFVRVVLAAGLLFLVLAPFYGVL